jgi:hypothetical protein
MRGLVEFAQALSHNKPMNGRVDENISLRFCFQKASLLMRAAALRERHIFEGLTLICLAFLSIRKRIENNNPSGEFLGTSVAS